MRTAAPLLPAERATREAILAGQEKGLAELLDRLHGRNPFYTRKLDQAGIGKGPLRLPHELRRLPPTTKGELVADQAAHPPWGTALHRARKHLHALLPDLLDHRTTAPLARHERELAVAGRVLEGGVSGRWGGAGRSHLLPFSFGPFLGFWVAFDAGSQIGAHCIPGGGMSSPMRLGLIETLGVTVVCCTPTYALRLAEVAAQEQAHGRPLRETGVRVVIVAGEPGGSIPATRASASSMTMRLVPTSHIAGRLIGPRAPRPITRCG